MTILVTGATGFVGKAVVNDLAAKGRNVAAVARRESGGWPPNVRVSMVSDTSDIPDLDCVDCIIHCAARAHVLEDQVANPLAAFRKINTADTIMLARAAASANVRRFIFLSSAKVNGEQTSGAAFSAFDEPAPHSPYAISKHEAELGLAQIARETGLEIVIIRPPLVMGAHPKGNLGSLERAIAKGVPLPFGRVNKNRRDLVSLDTLASLIETCIDAPGAVGETFMVSDGEPLSTRGIVEAIAATAGLNLRLLPVPRAMLKTALRVLGKDALASQLLGDLEVDIRHTIATLNWHPPVRGA